MDASAKAELNSIISELNSIITELNNISDGVKNDFKNIGNNSCSQCIDRVSNQYSYVVKRLNKIDTNKLAEGFGNAVRTGFQQFF